MMRTAMLWSVLSFVFTHGSGILIFIIIATQVEPHIFGVVAVAAIAVDFVSLEGRYAVMDAIMQAGRFDKRSLNSAFSAFLILVAFITAVLAITAPHVGSAYNEPLIATFMPLFGLMLVPVPWIAVMDALMMRDLRYKQTAARSVAATVVGGIVGIAVAFSPYVLWALFIQRLVTLIVQTGFLYKYTHWLPKFELERRTAVDFLRRFMALWTMNTLAVTIGRVTLLIFGLRYDITTVGLMRAANRVTDSVQGPTVTPLMGLWFPLMLKVKGDVEGEREVYRSIVRTAALITLPAFTGLAVVAPDLVDVMLPAEYSGVTPILQALSITLLQIPLLWFNNGAMAALNMNKVALAYTIALVITSLGTLILLTNGLSPPHAILIQSIPAAIMGVIGNVIVNRRLHQSNLSHYFGLMPAALACLTMAGATWLLARELFWAPALLRLIACVLVGGVVYFGWLVIFHREWLKECVSLLISRRKATKADEPTESTTSASA